MKEIYMVFVEDDIMLGAYSSKFKAFERVLTSWLYEDGIDGKTLIDYDGNKCDDLTTHLHYKVFKIELDSIDLALDIEGGGTQYSVTMPKTLKDLKDWITIESRDEKINTII